MERAHDDKHGMQQYATVCATEAFKRCTRTASGQKSPHVWRRLAVSCGLGSV